jgi:hypothetical protein
MQRLLFAGGAALAAFTLAACGVAATHPVEATPSGAPRSGVVETTTADGTILRLRSGAVFAVLNGDASRWTGDSVRVISGERIMLNARLHDRAEVTYVGDPAKPRIYSNTGEHTQESGSTDGSLLLLDDGSVWVVTPEGRAHTHLWEESSTVNVEPGPHGLYRLANPSSGTSVLAAYVGEK